MSVHPSDDSDQRPYVVEGSDERDDPDPACDLDALAALAVEVLRQEGAPHGVLGLTLVDPSEIQSLKRDHFGVDEPTDVLAFPLDADGTDDSDDLGLEERLLGDVVLCPAVAAEQAPSHAGSYEAEVALLIIHGVLHVLGHDHAETADEARMQARERHYLQAQGYQHPVSA